MKKILIALLACFMFLVVSTGRASAVTIFRDDFESTPVGSLSPDYTLLSGRVEVLSVTQKDGTTGNALVLFTSSVDPVLSVGAVELTAAGVQSDFRMSYDFVHSGASFLQVYFRAQNFDNGYYVNFDRGNVEVFKVVNGVNTRLSFGNTVVTHSVWNHLTIEAVGNEIRATDNNTFLMRITDSTFASGKFFMASTRGSDLRADLVDNLHIETLGSIPRTPAAAGALPFSTGFDDLVVRDGVLQQPNIDLVDGSLTYIDAVQRDGSTGKALLLASVPSTVDLIGPGVQSDFRMSFDLHSLVVGIPRVFFRAQDLDSGYMFLFDRGDVQVFKVESGVSTLLASGRTTQGSGTVWDRFTIEAIGNEIQITDNIGMTINITDDTFASGKFFIEAFRERQILIDNIEFSALQMQVTIDIKPGSDPNSISPRSKGKIPVAILTTETFDATTVDEITVLFGATGTEAPPVQAALEDVDGDLDTDMILHFNTQDTSIVCGDTAASLTGKTFGGQAIEGSDSIKTVGCK